MKRCGQLYDTLGRDVQLKPANASRIWAISSDGRKPGSDLGIFIAPNDKTNENYIYVIIDYLIIINLEMHYVQNKK